MKEAEISASLSTGVGPKLLEGYPPHGGTSVIRDELMVHLSPKPSSTSYQPCDWVSSQTSLNHRVLSVGHKS